MNKGTPKASLTRQLLLNTVGDGIAAGLGFLTIVLVSRNLSVGAFGRFNIALSVMLVAAGLSGLGTTRAMVRFISGHLSANRLAEADQTAKVSLWFRTAVSVLLALLLLSSSDALAAGFFGNRELAPLLDFAAIGLVVVSVFACIKSILHSHQRFKLSVGVQLFVDVAKLGAVVVLLWYASLDASASVGIFALAPAVGVVIAGLWGSLWTQRPPQTQRAATLRLLGELLGYARWVFVSNVCATVYKFVGIFLLARMMSDHEVGIYGLALNVTYAFAILINSLYSVLLPRVSRYTRREEFTRYFRGSLGIVAGLGSLAAASLFLAYPLVPFFFGERYAQSIPILMWLGLSAIVRTSAVTLHVMIYSLNEPKILAYIDMARLVSMIVGCLLLIPALGVLAPALTSLAINVIVFGGLLIYLPRRLTRKAFPLSVGADAR